MSSEYLTMKRVEAESALERALEEFQNAGAPVSSVVAAMNELIDIRIAMATDCE